MPLPILISAKEITIVQDGTKSVVSFTPFDVRTDLNPIVNGDLILTGIKSTALLNNPYDDTDWLPESIEIVGSKLVYTYPEGSNQGNEGNIKAPAFDPAVRTKYGGWLAPVWYLYI